MRVISLVIKQEITQVYICMHFKTKGCCKVGQKALINIRVLSFCREHAADTLTHKSTQQIRCRHLVCIVSWSGSVWQYADIIRLVCLSLFVGPDGCVLQRSEPQKCTRRPPS